MMYIFIIFIFLFVVLIVIKHTNSEGTLSMSLWLFISYTFLLLTHFFSGISYYPGSFYKILPYFFLCILLLIIGDRVGSLIKSSSSKTFHVGLKKLCLLSFAGSVVLLMDLLRLNEINLGMRIQDYQISIIGVIGNALSGLGLLAWLASLYEYRINKIKISILSYLALLAYISGGIASGGRQAILIISVSSMILLIWSSKKRKILKSEPLFANKKSHKPWGLIIFIALFISYFFLISAVRTQIFKIDHKISMFENVFNAKTSEETVQSVNKLGSFSDMYIEALYYYSHELVELSILYKYYDHYPLFGLSQLHYIERRLEWLFGNQLDPVGKAMETAIDHKGKFFSHTWGTFIAQYIIDFGRFGTLVACFLTGLLTGIYYKKLKNNENSLTVIRQSIICAGIVFSIQLSPFSEMNWTVPLILSSFIKVTTESSSSKTLSVLTSNENN